MLRDTFQRGASTTHVAGRRLPIPGSKPLPVSCATGLRACARQRGTGHHGDAAAQGRIRIRPFAAPCGRGYQVADEIAKRGCGRCYAAALPAIPISEEG